MSTGDKEIPMELEDPKETALKRKIYLQQLLDEQRERENHQIAIKSQMGVTESYVTSVSLGWICRYVGLANDLPIWDKDRKTEDGRIKVNAQTVEELRQREPDWSRQLTLVRYLATRSNHKFPPILVAAWQDWVNNNGSDAWVNGRAKKSSVWEEPLDTKAVYIDLDYEKTRFFALDGQHRIMAIIGLDELIKNHRLSGKKKNGELLKGSENTLDEIIEEHSIINKLSTESAKAKIQLLMNESIGIEIIPSVLKDETYKEALMRLRSIFVHVNMTAKKLPIGVLAQLDEDDGFAIVARRTMVEHDLLKHDRVNTEHKQLAETSFEYTTLVTLREVAYLLLGNTMSKWKVQVKGGMPIRPLDNQLDKGVEELMKYFDALAEIPSHKDLIQNHSKSCGDYRIEEDNILFRPTTQMALADAIEYLTAEKDIPLNVISNRLCQAEINGRLRLRDKTSVWYGVLYEPKEKKVRIAKYYRTLCSDLFKHLLGGGTPEDQRIVLERKFRDARIITDGKYMGLDGKEVEKSKLLLPQPWS